MDLKKALSAFCLLMSLASGMEQEFYQTAIDMLSRSIQNKVKTVSYVSIVGDHGQTPPEAITDILNGLDASKYMFNREDVTNGVRNHFSIHESGGIAIWALPGESETKETDLKNQLWTLDQNVSGFKRCVVVVIDEFGKLDEMFDRNTGRYRAPGRLHCPAILIRPSR